MRFKHLNLCNFGSYRDEHDISLNTSPEKPVLVFLGGTGYGKSTIFDAINWSLYGKDYELDLVRDKERGRTILDYVNESALSKACDLDELVEMSATLYFEHDRNNYYIHQLLAAKPVAELNGTVKAKEKDRETLLCEITPSGDHRSMKYESIFMNEILPNNVKSYFLFDGDRIRSLAMPGSSQEVRDAIYRVVDLELIKNAQDHLTDIAKKYRRKIRKEATGDLERVEQEYHEAQEEIERYKRQRENLKSEQQVVQSQIKKLEAKIMNLPDTSELTGRRTELKKELKRIETRIDSIRSDLRGSTAKAALNLAAGPVATLLQELDEKRTKGEMPRSISKTLITDLLNMGKCICRTGFEEGDQIHQALTDRLERIQMQANDQKFLSLHFQLADARERISEDIKEFRRTDQTYHELEDSRRECGLQIEEIERELGQLPSEDIGELMREQGARNQALTGIEVKLGSVKRNLTEWDSRRETAKQKREKASRQQENVRRLQQRETLAQKVADALDQLYEKFAEKSRQDVEELTKAEFKHFVRSASDYHVVLTDDYELQVLDSNGNRALQRLSMGQSQCLSLSFITAISRVSEKHPPLVIDMPFSRLDQEIHDAMSARLPEITSQLLLFLIPGTEWNDVTAKNLRSKANHVYELRFDEKRRETSIVER